jgi:hypothetical protein
MVLTTSFHFIVVLAGGRGGRFDRRRLSTRRPSGNLRIVIEKGKGGIHFGAITVDLGEKGLCAGGDRFGQD